MTKAARMVREILDAEQCPCETLWLKLGQSLSTTGWAVNRRVASSNLARGAKFSFSFTKLRTSFLAFSSGVRSVM
jgi:hypothetical protein